MIIRMLVVWILLGLSVSGCTLKASTDGTTDFVSSTTGDTWWTDEGLVKQDQHARVFVALNYDNLLQDIAKGEGEYLQSFFDVLQVPQGRQPEIAQQLQQHYIDLSGIHVREDSAYVRQFLTHVFVVMENKPSPYWVKPFFSS